MPYGVVQIGLDSREHDLKHGEATTEAFASEQVTLSANVRLLLEKRKEQNVVSRTFMKFLLDLYINISFASEKIA